MIKDDTNWKILMLLQQNARMSNAEIGRIVGLTSPAVADRIKKMEDLGVIKGYRVDVAHTIYGTSIESNNHA